MKYDAQEYAERYGWRVFPVERGGKRPLTARGFKDATLDIDLIEAWWDQYPGANIGFALPPSLAVLDYDPRNTPEKHRWEVPLTFDTKTARTPGNGFHVYYGVPEGTNLVSSAGTGIDVKQGGKGYVLLPPSEIGGKKYRWMASAGEGIKSMPTDLRESLEKASDVVVPRGSDSDVAPKFFPWEEASWYGQKSLEGLVRTVQAAEVGQRNRILFWAVCKAKALADEGEVNADHALVLIEAAGEAAGLDREEVTRTMRSAWETCR